MKKFILPLITIVMFLSCSSDDDTNVVVDDDPVEEEGGNDTGDTAEDVGLLRITQVDAVQNLVTISNQGEGDIEVGEYYLCVGPGSYRTISVLTTESTLIASGELLTVSYEVAEEADGLTLFATDNFSTTDPSILLDYVQWGEEGQARVGQAVTAGRWDDIANVAPGVSVYTFNGGSGDVGSTFWTGEEEEVTSIVRILSVDAASGLVTLTNFGNTTIDVGEYYLCLGPGTYRRIESITTEDTNLAANGSLEIAYAVDASVDGLSVFSINTFGSSDPEILVDFVQWGAGGQDRSGQAVTAGRWGDTTNFVPAATTYEFVGGAQDVGVAFWQ